MKLPLVILPALLLLGCGGTMTNVPTLYVDADFGPDMENVELAATAYAPAGVAFRMAILSHDDLVKFSNLHEPNTVYLVATHRMDEADCPNLDRAVINPGITKESGGSAVSCIDVDYIRDTKTPEGEPLVMRRAVAHELGHALMGPAHFGTGLMENSYLGVVVPQCDDYRVLVTRISGTVLPEKCR